MSSNEPSQDRLAESETPSEEESSRRLPAWWLAALAVFFVALFLWSELRLRTEREVVNELHAIQTSVSEENRRLTQKNNQLSADIATLTSADTQTIRLTGEQFAPGASGKAFIDVPHRRAIVFLASLPPNAGDKSYQLWLTTTGAKAQVSVAVFDADKSGAAKVTVPSLPEGDVKGLSVTLEAHGGSAAPSGTTVLASHS